MKEKDGVKANIVIENILGIANYINGEFDGENTESFFRIEAVEKNSDDLNNRESAFVEKGRKFIISFFIFYKNDQDKYRQCFF